MSDDQQAPERGWEAHAIAVVKQFYDEWWDNDRRRCLDAIIKRLTPLSSDLAPVAQPPIAETLDGLVRTILRPVRGCATDSQYSDAYDRAIFALTSAQQQGSEQAWKDAIAAVPKVGVTFPQGYEEWIDAPSYRESVIEALQAAAIRAAKQQ